MEREEMARYLREDAQSTFFASAELDMLERMGAYCASKSLALHHHAPWSYAIEPMEPRFFREVVMPEFQDIASKHRMVVRPVRYDRKEGYVVFVLKDMKS